jgi:hypothetical protein
MQGGDGREAIHGVAYQGGGRSVLPNWPASCVRPTMHGGENHGRSMNKWWKEFPPFHASDSETLFLSPLSFFLYLYNGGAQKGHK